MCDHLVAFAHLGHAGTDRRDRPGRLRPERHRSRAADPPATDPDELVPIADAGGGDVDQDLAFGRRPRLVHLEDLDGLAECGDPGRSHPVPRTLLMSVMPARTAVAPGQRSSSDPNVVEEAGPWTNRSASRRMGSPADLRRVR